ncbi:hypothetical protein SAMD00019534_125780, partial [Acytostelium subglobosum LB1]|uniref:hypothetical protein n=1 Tax=Acytostelium subglobosum LB1 TaxID=1410327 RepID=UPI00064488D5
MSESKDIYPCRVHNWNFEEVHPFRSDLSRFDSFNGNPYGVLLQDDECTEACKENIYKYCNQTKMYMDMIIAITENERIGIQNIYPTMDCFKIYYRGAMSPIGIEELQRFMSKPWPRFNFNNEPIWDEVNQEGKVIKPIIPGYDDEDYDPVVRDSKQQYTFHQQ